MNHLSGAELRLDLAAAEAEKPQTIRGIMLKRNKVRDLTQELVKRGCY
jgi:hypothetical protein